ncbi:MAG: hypothetical protein JWM63_2394 [Gammaproteobacteria bacterium]|nr:hypothetical protein [Gammaproteobacteria bacterium]
MFAGSCRCQTQRTPAGDRLGALRELIGNAHLPPGGLLQRQLHHNPLHVRANAILRVRASPRQLLQRQLGTSVI